jgi:hypothetical protein
LEDHFGLLLVVILASLMILGLLADSEAARALNLLVAGALFFFTLWVSAVSRRTILIATVVVPVIVALAGLAGASGASAIAGSAALASALLVIACVVVIIRRMARHERISLRTVLASLCIYLLAAIFFAQLYHIIESYSGVPFFAQTENPESIDFIYFSFVSITTLGFGDLSPASDLGKMAAVVEAVVGQIYLVTVVALFISNLGYKGNRSSD